MGKKRKTREQKIIAQQKVRDNKMYTIPTVSPSPHQPEVSVQVSIPLSTHLTGLPPTLLPPPSNELIKTCIISGAIAAAELIFFMLLKNHVILSTFGY